MPKKHASLLSESNPFQEMTNIQDLSQLIKATLTQLESFFKQCNISIYLLNTETQQVNHTASNNNLWPIPPQLVKWFSQMHKGIIPIKSDKNYIYVQDMESHILTHFKQLKRDQLKHKYSCNDGLYYLLQQKSKQVNGIIFINAWHLKKPLKDLVPELDKTLNLLSKHIASLGRYIEATRIQNKIKDLTFDKTRLSEKLKKDEKSLHRKVSELNSLHTISNTVLHSFDFKEIFEKVSLELKSIIQYEACSFLHLPNASNKNQYQLHIKFANHCSETNIVKLKNKLVTSFVDLIPKNHSLNELKLFSSFINNHSSSKQSLFDTVKEINLPLSFENELIGILSLIVPENYRPTKDDFLFIHTLSKHIASTVGRINIIKELEQSKISSLASSLGDAIILTSDKLEVELINPKALEILKLPNSSIKKETLEKLLQKLGIHAHLNTAIKTHSEVSNIEVQLDERFFYVTISPLEYKDMTNLGFIISFSEITEIKKTERVNSQRLNSISQLNDILKSMQSVDKVLPIILDLFLELTNTNIGSIEIKKENAFFTKHHRNFPEKISKSFTYKNGTSISNLTKKTKKIILIEPYDSKAHQLNKNTRVHVECYICIPILLNNECIAIINLARKCDKNQTLITKDDIDTIKTITNFTATIIQNAILYEKREMKQRMEQEIQIAFDIQKKILKEEVPSIKKLDFGLLNVPSKELGGDYYEFIKITDTKSIVILSDIVGKGMTSGLLMAVLKSIFVQNIKKDLSPKDCLETLNNVIYNDPIITKFVPLFLCVIDSKNMTLTYANAGHEPPLLIRGNKLINLEATGFPLGGFPDEVFTQRRVTLKENDILALFTDGITEIQNKSKQLFGTRRLTAFIRKNKTMTAAVLAKNIYNYIDGYADPSFRRDDITLILCKINSKTKTVTKSKLIAKKNITVSSKISNVKVIRKEIESVCQKLKVKEEVISDLKLSVNEVHTNIIQHAYFGDESKEILFKLLFYDDKIEIIIRDYGASINIDKPSLKAQNIETLQGSGLGVFLYSTLMDNVEHKALEIGSETHLVKYNIWEK